MKVSLVIPSFYPAVVYGGPIFATLHASEALARRGMKIYVSTTNANGKRRLDIETGRFLTLEPNLHVKYYSETIVNRLSLPMLFGLYKDLKRADIVHIQSIFSIPSPAALRICAKFGKPVLLSPRGSLCRWCLEGKTPFKKIWLDRFVRPFIDRVVWHATSRQELEDIKFHFPDARVELIPDGVNVDEFAHAHPLTRREFAKKFANVNIEPSHIIVSMGRLHRVKGFDILIEAFEELNRHEPSAALFIAGKDDGDLSRLKSMVEKKKLQRNVFFTGPLSGSDKVDFLANADLFVLASHTENFGIVVAESLASGTPVVASDKTPWRLLEEERCGRWVPNNPPSISQAILHSLDTLDYETSKRAKRLASRFDWNTLAEKFETLFEDMLEKSRKTQ